jgi:O-antigen/teichoic acid export membrane protein
LFISIGAVTNSTFLQGVGETKVLMKLRVVGLLTGIPLAFLLIPQFEIFGLIFSVLFASLPGLFIGIYWIWNHYRIKFDLSSSLKIIIASLIAGVTTYLFLNIFVAAAWIMLTIGAILFLSVYLLFAPLIGAITQSDINNLRVMFSGLGLMSKIFGIILSIVEKPLKINAKRIRIKKQK